MTFIGRAGSSPVPGTSINFINNIYMKEQVNQKRTLSSTFVLLAAMLISSARDAAEKNIARLIDAMFAVDDPTLNDQIDELIKQGYLTVDGDNTIRMTKFGEKISLQSTSNTPNFSRLAQQNANTAFAMLFAGFTALSEKHLIGQEKIVAGANGSEMVDNLTKMVEYFNERLDNNPVAEAEVETPVKKKTKKEVVAA